MSIYVKGLTPEQIDLNKRWIEALESGEYKQTKNFLYDGVGYCCLGVACKVAGREFTQVNDYWKIDGEGALLPYDVMDELGLYENNGLDENHYDIRPGVESGEVPLLYDSLTTLNDLGGHDFKQIAQVIRKQLEDATGEKVSGDPF